jgi:hypothetical protein
MTRRTGALVLLFLLTLAAAPRDTGVPRDTSLTAEERRAILAKTADIRLSPNLKHLTANERDAVTLMLQAGRIMQSLYEESRHRQAAEARARIDALRRTPGRQTEARELADLYRLNSGPIVTRLDNARVPIMAGIDTLVPGRAVYPWGVTKVEIERWLSAHPDQRGDLLDPLTVVRRRDTAQLEADQELLTRHPALAVLHPSLEGRIRAMRRASGRGGFYAIPYALAYADSLEQVSGLLHFAADRMEKLDPEFAGYLRLRATDLLANDYEGGDAAWVSGHFRRLNLQLGAYETYDDELYGSKAFHSASVLIRDEKASDALRRAIRNLQELENSLPYEPHRRVRDEISVGIYDVIADFGQARGTNTASILPNEPLITGRYGRTILMRRNILLDPVLVASARTAWRTATDSRHATDFDPEARMQRVLWHEIGHYLGPSLDMRNRPLRVALEENSGTFEEMKADLVALFVARQLRASGYYDDHQLRGVYAAGIDRVLLKSRPRRDQVYQTMELMQMNWYLDRKLLEFDDSGKLKIHYERYHDVVASLLREVIAIQKMGDRGAADRFITRWAVWDQRHERLAEALRSVETSRFRQVRYAALGE